jgi:hypothetical protein
MKMEAKKEQKSFEKSDDAKKKMPVIIELEQPQLEGVVGGLMEMARRCPPGNEY